MSVAPAGTAARRRELLLPAPLLLLGAFALFAAARATSPVQIVLLVVAGLAGLGLATGYSWRAYGNERAQRRALERTLEASRAEAEFLWQASRELRAPLAVIGGMAERLERTPLSDAQRDDVAVVRRSSTQILRTIEDMLCVSGLEEGAASARQTAFSLADVVGETACDLAPRAAAKGLTLVCDVASEQPDAVRGDRERLGRVLKQLLLNAINVRERGGVVLRVKPGAAAEHADLVEFSVLEDGIGVPAAGQERPFRPPAQGNSSVHPEEGPGLGLSVAARLVETMGGRIRVDSKGGQGDRFHFAIPLPSQGQSRPIAAGGISLQGLRALVLEGGAGEREALGRLLRSLGLEPTLVADAGAAAEELRRAAGEGRPYAVMLLDASMRGSAAFRARRKEDDRVLAGTPRVQLWTQTRLAAAAPDPGPRVLKPVTRADLVAALQQALRGEVAAAAAPLDEPARSAPSDRARVLVVDESPVRALVTSRIVELAGGEALVVTGPGAVPGALAAQAFAVVVLDGDSPEHRACEPWILESRPELAIVRSPLREAELRAVLERIRPAPPLHPIGIASPLDRPRLVHNLGDDERAADQVLAAFVAQAGESLDALRGACSAGDLPALARAAHRIKGSLMWIGADRAALAAGSLESRANAGDADGARTIRAIVEDEVRAVVAAIRDAPRS